MSAPCPTFGFTVTVTMRDDVTESERDMFIDDLLALLAPHGLSAAGQGDRVMEFVVRRDGSQATDADRTIVRDWAGRWTSRAEIDVSDIVDLALTD
jgi:uncharacterized protein YggL (DUF469 family)